MKCRKNVKNLSPAEREIFARAVNLLKNEPSVVNPGGQNRYDDFAKAHLDTMTAGADWTHGDSAFFPWHRELIYHFELELDRMVFNHDHHSFDDILQFSDISWPMIRHQTVQSVTTDFFILVQPALAELF